MVNFKKIKMGNIILLLVWDSTNEQGKEYKKNVEGLKQLKKKKAYTELVSNYRKEAETSQSTMLFEEFL